jgi:hypothetical protein
VVAEVFVEFTEPVVAKDGRQYLARACGGEGDKGMWQGWIEFLPIATGEPIRSSRETTQPNRQDTEYWATGLTPVYLQGALERSLHPLTRKPSPVPPRPAFSGPASAMGAPPPANEAVLNPFSVYRKGEALLRKQLGALSGWRLVNIVTAFDLSRQGKATLAQTPAPMLVELIVSAVAAREESVPPGE